MKIIDEIKDILSSPEEIWEKDATYIMIKSKKRDFNLRTFVKFSENLDYFEYLHPTKIYIDDIILNLETKESYYITDVFEKKHQIEIQKNKYSDLLTINIAYIKKGN